MTRPVTITCKGCGDPDVQVGEKGQIPTYCYDCAGFPRNPAHKGWSGNKLRALREERRRQREVDETDWADVQLTLVEEFPADNAAHQGEEEETHDHAHEVADDQAAAQAYWGGGSLQPPDGPVQLNTPVDYDPAADPLVGGGDDLWADEAVDSTALDAEFEPPVTVGPVDEAPDLPDEPAAVCIAHGCELPDPGHGHDLFCRGHWRLVTIETRQRVLGAPAGPARNSAVHRALFEIRRRTGG